jgi:hypothetical protein
MKRNLNLKNILLFVFVFSFIIGLSVNVDAQRRRSKSSRTKATAAAQAKAKEAAELKQGAIDVGIQLKNVSKFVYILGGVARGIEDIDKDIKAGRASREVADRNAEFKANVIRSIRSLRAGLAKLETDFKTTLVLRKYSFNLQNVLVYSGRAEDLALAGRFNDSGKELLLAVESLTDTLVAMP